MDTNELASKLVDLERLDHQYDLLVRQIVESQRQAATRRIVTEHGSTPSSVANDMAVLDSALEKIEYNLRSQYEDYRAAHIALRSEKFTAQQLADFVDLLADARIQKYLEAKEVFRRESEAQLSKLVNRIAEFAIRPF